MRFYSEASFDSSGVVELQRRVSCTICLLKIVLEVVLKPVASVLSTREAGHTIHVPPATPSLGEVRIFSTDTHTQQ